MQLPITKTHVSFLVGFTCLLLFAEAAAVMAEAQVTVERLNHFFTTLDVGTITTGVGGVATGGGVVALLKGRGVSNVG